MAHDVLIGALRKDGHFATISYFKSTIAEALAPPGFFGCAAMIAARGDACGAFRVGAYVCLWILDRSGSLLPPCLSLRTVMDSMRRLPRQQPVA